MQPHEDSIREGDSSRTREEPKQAGAANGTAIDKVILETIGHRAEPMTLPALVDQVHEKNQDVGDMEVRYALWRLIDRGRVVLDRERRIRSSAET